MNATRGKTLTLTLLRMAIGWHFLWEGLSKFIAGDWSAAEYLAQARGPLAGLYHALAASSGLMTVVDWANILGLTAIGLALFLGLAVRIVAGAGIVLLGLYYLAYPPFGGALPGTTEGHLFIVNKQLLEALALAVLLLSRESGYGLDSLRALLRRCRTAERGDPIRLTSRRESLKHLASLPALGLMGVGAYADQRKYGTDAMSGATIQVGGSDLSELKGKPPQGKLGPHSLSRLVLGGNLIGGWAHARDLRYVSSLFKAYNTEAKVFQTLQLAEQAGINAINIGFASNALLQKYKRVTGSRITVISQVHPDMEHGDYFVNIQKAIDYGVEIIQVQGNWCDWLVRDGKTEVIAAMLDRIRQQGLVAGLGAHTVDSLIVCQEQGIVPDYYMKTMHHDRYWSAHPRENRHPFEVDGKQYLDHNRFHNNLFCLFPEKTAAFVEQAEVPVMGFKVLAAGALLPDDGFEWAFRHGADFICVGMFDFQIVDDVNTSLEVLANLKGRTRRWFA